MPFTQRTWIALVAIVPAPLCAQTDLWSANTGANSVTVTDTRTRTAVATVPVGTAPVDVALSPDGSRAYTADFRSSSVTVIDTAARSVLTTIAVGSFPAGVGVTRDGSKLYVVRDFDGTIAIVDTATNAITGSITTARTNGGLGSVTFTPDGSRAYITAGGVLVVDTATDQVVDSFSAGFCSNLAIAPDGSMVWCTDSFLGAVYGFDTATHTLQSTTPLGGLPGSIALTRDGTKAFVAVPAVLVMINGVGAPSPRRWVQVVDLAAHSVTTTLTIAQPPSGIAATVDGTRICIAMPLAGEVLELDPVTNAPIAQYPIGAPPNALAMAPAPATVAPYGAACTPPTGPLTLVADTLPWLGEVWQRTANGVAPGALAASVVGTVDAAVSLAAVHPSGVAGCDLLVAPLATNVVVATGGAATLSLPLPRLAALIGADLREQVLQFDGSSLSGSNGLHATLGMR